MLKTRFLVVTMFFALLLACLPVATPLHPSTPFQPVHTELAVIPVTGMAIVQSVEVQFPEAQPLQVNTFVRGQLPQDDPEPVVGGRLQHRRHPARGGSPGRLGHSAFTRSRCGIDVRQHDRGCHQRTIVAKNWSLG